MKSSKINLDLTKKTPESSSLFSKVPAGIYTVTVRHSQFKEGKTPGAAGLQVGYMIEHGEHAGKMIQDYINIANSNEKAVEIGLQRLRRICDLQSRKSFKLQMDTDLINSTEFSIEVSLEENEYNGNVTEVNRVKKLLASDTVKKEEPAVVKEVIKSESSLPWES